MISNVARYYHLLSQCCFNAFRLKIKLGLLLIILVGPFSIRAQRPNIIYIMTDDMGYGDLSCYGQKKFQTPNLDKLASQGVKFLNAYSAGPLCTPTRVGFITGRYPARIPVGLIEPLTASNKDTASGLTPDNPSIATLMKASGYKTALIGKWHLGIKLRHNPIQNGFEYFYGIKSGAADYLSHKGDNRLPDLYENNQLVSHKGYLTDLFTQKAIEFLKQKHDKPFFLALTYTAPHWPWQGADDAEYADSVNYRNGGTPAIYAAMMKSLDNGIGMLMQTLDEIKLSENTIVIFTNDNGGERYSDNGGLTNGKGSLWEGGIKVPAFVRWPGKIEAGTSTKQVAITMDWTATILSVAKLKVNQAFAFDGIDLMPVMTGEKIKERKLFWRTYQRKKQKAIRQGDWKYLQDENGEYLFDLSMDPQEKHNLRDTEQTIFNKLKKAYAEWEKTVLQPVPL